MKVLWVDLSLGSESLSIEPNRYGGGQIVPSWCRELLDGFFTLACEKSYEDILPSEKKENCLTITEDEARSLRNGFSLKKLLHGRTFDLVCHNHSDIHLNLEGMTAKQAVWVSGYAEQVHPHHDFVFLHSADYQKPQFGDFIPEILKVKIGKPVPIFQEYKKQDYIFQCTNHAPCFQSIVLAQICVRNKIPLFLGGPISEGYPLLDYVDGKIVQYLGVMSYKDKIEKTKFARAHTLLHTNPINWTLSGMEALAYGTPLITSRAGFWPTFITPKIGFHAGNEAELVAAYDKCPTLSQKDCYNKALQYSNFEMVKSFAIAFAKICYRTTNS